MVKLIKNQNIAGIDPAMAALKVPPHSIEAEQSVLGGLMLANEAWDNIAERISEQDFYRQDHRTIYRAISFLIAKDSPSDAITISEYLNDVGELDRVGGLAYLSQLVQSTPSAANIRAYADIVRERSVLRQLITVGTDIADAAYTTQGRESAELLDEAERRVFEIAEQRARSRQGFVNMQDLLVRTVDRIDTLYHSDSPLTGIGTGYDDFDRMTAGMQRSDLLIVAGRPSMGKTSFAMNVAEHVAIKERKPVAIFSMEMPAEQLSMRMISSLGRIDQRVVRTGKLTDDDWPRLTSAVSLLSEAPMYIDDSAGLTPGELRARARRLMKEHKEEGLGLIVIDYLQLMSGSARSSSENRATEIAEISRSLKNLAKELNVPIMALSQLNRSLEQRTDKRPVMSDLRESGAIEQDADVIVFIYRDEVYNEDTPDKGVAEIIISKQRNGPIGTVRLTFLGKYTRFENFTPEYYPEDNA
jgi:replicative DNA helicase